MRYLLLILLPVFGYSQKIDINEFDRIDSTYVIKTKLDAICTKWSSALGVNALYSHNISDKFKALGDTRRTFISFRINISDITSMNDKSLIKIEYGDGSVVEYTNVSQYNIFGGGNVGDAQIQVKAGDPIFNKPIKTIRFSSSNFNIDFEIKSKNQDMVKKQLALIESQPTHSL